MSGEFNSLPPDDTAGEHLRLGDVELIIPFGRFTTGNGTAPEEPGLLVGREEERARLIDALTSMGPRGSFLVTGRRGIGKSSFVAHCLSEYQANVFKRFQRSRAGKSVLDKLALFIFAAFAILFGLILSDIARNFAKIAGPPDGLKGFLAIVVAAIGMMLATPLLYASALTDAVFAALFFPSAAKASWWRIVAPLVMVFAVAAAWYLPPFGDPAWTNALFLFVLGWWYAVVQVLSYLYPSNCRAAGHGGTPSPYWWYTFVFLFAAGAMVTAYVVWSGLWGSGALPLSSALGPPPVREPPYAILVTLVVFALIHVAIGSGARGWHLVQKRRWDDRPTLSEARTQASVWYFLIVIVVLIFTLIVGYAAKGLFSQPECQTALIITGCVTVLGWVLAGIGMLLMRWRIEGSGSGARADNDCRSRGRYFVPQPHSLLILKAIVVVAVTVQLVHPVVRLALQILGLPLGSPVPSALPMLAEQTDILNSHALELPWIITLSLLALLFFVIEFEWVMRPFVTVREDRALDPGEAAPWQDQAPLPVSPREQPLYRRLEQLTFPWIAYNAWLPTLVTTVNLGFDKLDHRGVVQAMLVGLRNEYHRHFLAWNAPVANLARLLFVAVVLVLVTQAGARWFRIPLSPTETPFASIGAVCEAGAPADLVKSPASTELPPAVRLLCATKFKEIAYAVLYFDLVEINGKLVQDKKSGKVAWPPSCGVRGAETAGNVMAPQMDSLMYRFTDLQCPPPGSPKDTAYSLSVRVYHVLLFMAFFLAGRWVFRQLPILPYRQNLERIDELLDGLTARLVKTRSRSRWKSTQVLQDLFAQEDSRQLDQEPLDPRAVELALMNILQECQGQSGTGWRAAPLTLPVPEITFIFDELDKLGVRLDAEISQKEAKPEELELMTAERQRSLAMNRLLSNLKRVIASAPARFVFVGGRLLHDEWLADAASRQPLLTSIFDAEIYISALLTDHADSDRGFDGRVAEYFAHLREHANRNFAHMVSMRWTPLPGQIARGVAPPTYRAPRTIEDKPAPNRTGKDGSDTASALSEIAKNILPARPLSDMAWLSNPWRQSFMRDLMNYLTYRSTGSPKRLRELIAGFVRPAGRSIHKDLRWNDKDYIGQDVLRFRDKDIFRIQLLSAVYEHLMDGFGSRLAQRDDKVVVSILHLSDFLLKFHRRAFGWNSLERIDELVHIHRAPDLRKVLEQIVDHASERFLHRLLNGMYAFRFRSDIAREIEYISRESKEEMAAFNFTLDESQSLKAAYTVLLRSGGENAVEINAGLGELYDYDQEYDSARQHYRKAIQHADAALAHVLAPLAGKDVTIDADRPQSIVSLLDGENTMRRLLDQLLPWSILRLRLMLQIAMTFEQSRNLERAEAEYRAAHGLAMALITLILRASDAETDSSAERRLQALPDNLHALKHLTLLYQPLFATAWVAEKLSGAVDTSLSMVEGDLAELRFSLPFLKDAERTPTSSPFAVAHSNFALLAADLHDKVGDLYFFKGRQFVAAEQLSEMVERDARRPDMEVGGQQEPGPEGYLLQAYYHYAVGLNELRHYVTHRIESSQNRLHFTRKDGTRTFWRTVLSDQHPTFIGSTAANLIADISEALLARVSFFGAVRRLTELNPSDHGPSADGAIPIDEFRTRINKWLAGAEGAGTRDVHVTLVPAAGDGSPALIMPLGNPELWFGRWCGQQADSALITFERPNYPERRLVLALLLAHTAADYLHESGYPEDAAREHLQVAETVAEYLWWLFSAEHLAKSDTLTRTGAAREFLKGIRFDAPRLTQFKKFLLDFGITALRRADEVFSRNSRSMAAGRGAAHPAYRMGADVPCSVLPVMAALALAAHRCDIGGNRISSLAELYAEWHGGTNKPTTEGEWRSSLRMHVYRHRFPMLSRLNAMKVLIDDSVIGGNGSLDEAIAWALELCDFEERYQAPFHFTPHQCGVTLALLDRRLRADGHRQAGRFRGPAIAKLTQAREMYTQGRAYYDAIAPLHYLYDDFNDRQIHRNHALQMAGSELQSILWDCTPETETPSPKAGTPVKSGSSAAEPSATDGQALEGVL